MRHVVLVGALFFPPLAGADEVFVRGGGRLSGEVVERGPDFVFVDIGTGRIGLPLSYVERIVPGVSPVALYRERAARLAEGDAAGWLALGRWAHDQDLVTNAREAFEHVLALDPGNVAANRALGHVQVGHQWMTLEESYRARGYVRFEGDWVIAEERRAILAERTAAAEELRAQAEAEARVREAEARARAAEADARRAEVELARAEVDVDASWWFPGSGFTPWIVTNFPAVPYGRSHRRFHAGFNGPFRGCATSFSPRYAHPNRPFGVRRALRTSPSPASVKTRVRVPSFQRAPSTRSHR